MKRPAMFAGRFLQIHEQDKFSGLNKAGYLNEDIIGGFFFVLCKQLL
jgi:hypothetical protein